MTYQEILIELKEVDLKEKFTSSFESFASNELLMMIKESDKLHSTAGMIRLLMKYIENESEQWLFWQKVLFYFMTPEFARINKF